MKIYLDVEQQGRLLYYDIGFEQSHPIPLITAWMRERGWEYYRDYRCVWRPTDDPTPEYYMEFSDDKIAAMFVLRWM